MLDAFIYTYVYATPVSVFHFPYASMSKMEINLLYNNSFCFCRNIIAENLQMIYDFYSGDWWSGDEYGIMINFIYNVNLKSVTQIEFLFPYIYERWKDSLYTEKTKF